MPQLAASHRAARFCPILGIANEVRQLRSSGVALIDLSVGVPNFLPAPHVYAGASAAMAADRGGYGSSRGDPALIDAYLTHLAGEGLPQYGAGHVVMGLGAKHLLHCAVTAVVERGDPVLIPTPCWPTYFDIVELAGGTVVPLPCGVAQGYKLDPQALKAALTPATRLVILNNPCNPTGAVYGRDELDAIAQVLRTSDCWIVSDDVYSRFVAPEVDFCHLLQVAPDLADRVIKIDSVSKMYGMPGWRVGMLAAPAAVADAVVSLNSNSISNLPDVAAAAAAAALRGDQQFSLRMRADYLRKRDIVLGRLGRHPRVRCPRPDGAFYLFPDVSACFGRRWRGETVDDDLALARLLLEQARVAVVPGRYFGAPGSLRLSCSGEDAALAEGADRIVRLLDQLS